MMYEDRPLVQKLIEFNQQTLTSFHVPGHKAGLLSRLPSAIQSALPYDVTELSGLDDLHEPEGVIAEAQRKLTDLYKANASYFLVNGSTVGNLAMIYATCSVGDTVIVQRNAHKSIFNALELVGAQPVLLTPEWNERTSTASVVGIDQVRHALQLYPKAKAMILTYPTYYGQTGESIQDIIRTSHQYKIPVLVDEAHGAHFIVGEPFPTSALELGADVVVHSAHKTLPAMTMASFLHVKSTLVCHKRVAKYLRMLQSSSPSYLLMASLDDARAYAETYTAADTAHFLKERKNLIQQLKRIERIQVVEGEDPLKLMIRVEGYSGFQLLEVLEDEGVYVELADPYQVLLVLPLLKKESVYNIKKIVSGFKRAIQSLNMKEKIKQQISFPVLMNEITELCYNREELERFDVAWMNYEEALGKVAAESVIPYPPGIPLLLAGERVKESAIESLHVLTNMQASFQGAICTKKKQILVVTNE